MKAGEARRRSIESVADQITQVKEQIRQAVHTGQMCVTVLGLKPATRAWLLENDYNVTHVSTPGDDINNVSW